MSRRASYLAVAAAAALGFALIAWVSSAGSVQMLQTPKATASPPQLPRPLPNSKDQPPAQSARQRPRLPRLTVST